MKTFPVTSLLRRESERYALLTFRLKRLLVFLVVLCTALCQASYLLARPGKAVTFHTSVKGAGKPVRSFLPGTGLRPASVNYFRVNGLPADGEKNFAGYNLVGAEAASPDGFFLVTNSLGVNLYADIYGLSFQLSGEATSYMGKTGYIEVKAQNGMDNFKLIEIAAGEYSYRDDYGTDFSNVYIEGFYREAFQGKSSVITSVGDGTVERYAISLSALEGKHIDKFRIYFTAGSTTPLDAFNLVSFSIADAQAAEPAAPVAGQSLWTWGNNQYGQLGDGSTENVPSPKEIAPGVEWKSISSSSTVSLAIKSDGSLWAWGKNTYGQLGDGSAATTTVTSPKQIGTAKDWATIEMGANFVLALKTDGSLWAWGKNTDGQLGDGTKTDSFVPKQIGSAKDWAWVSAGFRYSMAIKTDGSLWAWGYNAMRFGDGTETDSTVPKQVGTAKDWATVSAGYAHTSAIKKDGTLWGTGFNDYGQVTFPASQLTFREFVRTDSGTDWKQVSIGRVNYPYVLAIKSDGSLWAWGKNTYGHLGDGTTTNITNAPKQVGTTKDWAKVSLGTLHVVGLKTDGSLWAWGKNSYMQFGDGTTTDSFIPKRIGTDSWGAVSAGGGHTMALKISGSVSPPVITLQPAPLTVCAGFGSSFSVTASNATSYQWQEYTSSWNDLADGEVYSGATAATLSITNVAGLNGRQYRCVVSGAAEPAAISQAVTVTVQEPTAITAQPQSVTVKEGELATFTATASGIPAPTIQWQSNRNGVWENIAGATTTSLTFAADPLLDKTKYRVLFSNACGAAVVSQEAVLTVTVISTPAVVTASASSVTASSAVLGGNVTADGGGTVMERGVVFSQSSAPTTADSKVIMGAGSGSFTQEVTGLAAGTPYYVKAYAINAAGISYGDEVTVTTLSANANLSNLVLSTGILSPAFASGTINYSATVPYAVTSVNVTATVADATATMKVNGAAATSGSAQSISLNVGANTVPVLVTAQDGTQKTYTVTITRAAASANADLSNISLSAGNLTPAFAPGTISYASTVAHDVASVNITPTIADATATLTVNGIAAASGSPVSVSLASGSTKSVPVTVTAQNGNTKTYTLAITRPFPPVVASISSSTNVSCNGGANGSASVAASGGTEPYAYNWSPSGGTGATASGLAAGSYTVTVTDANGQTATANVTITQPAALSVTGAQTDVSCFGGSNGSATISVSGGTEPYTYEWSHGSEVTIATASGLAAGRYTVTVTDANGCTVTGTFTITQPSALTATVATTPVTTVGGNNGEATVTAAGGTAPYTYNWSPTGGTGATASNLAAGTYTVTITDVNGCFITKTVTILEPTVTNVVAITKTATSPTNAATVGFNIVFDQPVTGVSASNFTLTTSGVSAASIASVAAVNSTTYTITVNTGTGSGEVSLNLDNDNGMSLTVQNLPVNGNEKYTIDKTPPAVPSAPDLLATSDSGSSDNITNKTTLTFEGTADPETAVKLYAGAQEVGTTTSDVNGNWQMTVTLATGTHNLTAKAVDALGNTSAASAALLVTVDVTAPAQPAILAFRDEHTTGGNNGFSRGNVLKLSGSAELGATVKVTLAAASQTKETVATSGAWEVDFSDLALADGTYTFEAAATDVAGNVSQLSASFTLTIDRVTPAAPVVASISEDTGLSNTDAITSDKNILISGTAEGNSKVNVTIDTDTYGPIAVASDGNWTLDLTAVTLADGTYTATATAQDAAGNVSDASSTFTFVVDNAVPSAPVIAAVSEDTGVSNTDGITNDQTLAISGTALAQSEVNILLNGTAIGTAVADANGDWSYTYASSITEGVHTLTAKATSVSGIVSSLSAGYTLTVDATAPMVTAASTAAPVVKAPFEITYTFNEAVSGFELNDLTLTNANATSLSANGNTYTVTITPATDGKVTAQLKAGTVTDLAGNVNEASGILERLYDVTLPGVTLASNAPEVTNAAFSVTVDFTEPVTDFEEGDLTVKNATVSNFSKVSDAAYTALITPLADGDVEVSVAADVAKDIASNGNEASAILSRTYDATKPVVTLATTAADPTNTPFTVTFSFSEEVFGFEVGDFTVTNGAASEFTKVDDQTYTTLVTPAADGHVTVVLAAGVASDKATNPSEASAELHRLYDATAPAGYAVAFNTTRVDVTNVTNISLRITGTEVGATYYYTIASDNGGAEVTGTAQVQQSGFALNALDLASLNDGTLTATFYLVDAAGNKGVNATAEVIKITRDIVAVTVPEVIKVPIRTTYANVPMPAKVEVTYSTGAKELLHVRWSQGTYNGLVAGAYKLTGELVLAPMTTNLTAHLARVTVEVQPNKVPMALAFSTATFKPEATANDVIGSFSTTDADDNEFIYTLVSGDGSQDNDLFELRGDKLYLRSNKGLSGITQLSIRVRSTDPYQNTIEQRFTLSKELYAKPQDQLKIVNAFSPDGDGINDTWIIPELRFYNQVEIEVFDRSGVRLFKTTNPEEGWNGKDTNGQVRQGAFFYIVQVKDINLVKKGVVTILKK